MTTVNFHDLTEREKNAPAGMSTIDGGFMTGHNPILNTAPAPAPTPTTTQAPTPTGTTQPNIQSELDRIKQEALRIQGMIPGATEPTVGQSFAAPTPDAHGDPVIEEYLRKQAYTEVNEDEINRRQMALFQKEIDATNQIYSGLMQEAQFQGQGRIGSQRAISARSGLIGSDFGEAQKETVMDYNRQIERGIAAEQAARIAAIQGLARKSAADEIAAKNAARMQGADAYLQYLAGARERKASNLQKLAGAMLEQGASPFDMDEQTLKEIAQQYGTTTGDIQSTFQAFKSQSDSAQFEADQKSRKTEAEIAKIEADIAKGKIITLGEGSMLYDTETGETFKNPKTFAPTTGATSGIKISGGVLPPDDISKVHRFLQSHRGKDGYTSTDEYMKEFNDFVQLGGDPKDFVKEFSPDIYINPKDETRSFLQQYMRRTPVESAQLSTEDLIGQLQTLRGG